MRRVAPTASFGPKPITVMVAVVGTDTTAVASMTAVVAAIATAVVAAVVAAVLLRSGKPRLR